MWKLDRPRNAADQVFTTCISRVQNAELKARLQGAMQAIVDASAAFDDAAANTRLHEIARHDVVGGNVTREEMEAVYTQRMARKGAPRFCPERAGLKGHFLPRLALDLPVEPRMVSDCDSGRRGFEYEARTWADGAG
jgi:hypothetical protein